MIAPVFRTVCARSVVGFARLAFQFVPGNRSTRINRCGAHGRRAGVIIIWQFGSWLHIIILSTLYLYATITTRIMQLTWWINIFSRFSLSPLVLSLQVSNSCAHMRSTCGHHSKGMLRSCATTTSWPNQSRKETENEVWNSFAEWEKVFLPLPAARLANFIKLRGMRQW